MIKFLMFERNLFLSESKLQRIQKNFRRNEKLEIFYNFPNKFWYKSDYTARIILWKKFATTNLPKNKICSKKISNKFLNNLSIVQTICLVQNLS